MRNVIPPEYTHDTTTAMFCTQSWCGSLAALVAEVGWSMYISVVKLPVTDIDRAVDFYTNILGWEKTMDVPMGESRWVTVAPAGPERTAFTLSKEEDSTAKAGGYSGIVIEVDDVFKMHEHLSKKGVAFHEGPRVEPWGS